MLSSLEYFTLGGSCDFSVFKHAFNPKMKQVNLDFVEMYDKEITLLISQCPNAVKYLDLSMSRISTEAVKNLSKFRNMKSLTLPVLVDKDAVISVLKDLKSLSEVNISGDSVSKEALTKQFPLIEFEYD